jgi:hypothetical protein
VNAVNFSACNIIGEGIELVIGKEKSLIKKRQPQANESDLITEEAI